MHAATFICLIFLFISSISIVGFSLYYGISPMPSSKKARKGMLSLIPAGCKTIFELGSGWGHLAFTLSRDLPDVSIHAFEASPIPWLISILAQKMLRRTNLTIKRKNFYNISFKEADCIVCYLYPGAMGKLEKKFNKGLKPGTYVITNTFSIPGWVPCDELEVDDLYKSRLFCYKKL
jgi:hypothetical protein